jgi:hypothetical protein
MWADSAQAQVPPTLAAPGEAVATIHAEGAQIYECKADSGGKVTWLFREPVATLVLDDAIGITVRFAGLLDAYFCGRWRLGLRRELLVDSCQASSKTRKRRRLSDLS